MRFLCDMGILRQVSGEPTLAQRAARCHLCDLCVPSRLATSHLQCPEGG
jgi:hypothetical protein